MSESHRLPPHILVVDDDHEHARAVSRVLEREGWRTSVAHRADEALQQIRQQSFDLVITDLKMPGGDGFDLVRAANHEKLAIDFVLMTAFGTVENAVEALRAGAEDFIIKPIKRAALVKSVERILRRKALEQENESLRARLADMSSNHGILGESSALDTALNRARSAANSEATILITGESGTGKELFARAVHAWSPRNAGPFVALHCGSLPESLIESELFGYEAGAFTGATRAKPGLLEMADRGTLFLDEIGELSLAVQVKLLRVLQFGEYTRVGSVQTRTIDARVVAATHRNLPSMIREGSFREDLYYRLNVIPVEVPALRDRGRDIVLLARAFLARHAEKNGRAPLSLSPDAQQILMHYAWPGNVRELDNIMQRVAVLAAGPVVEAQDLPAEWQGLETAQQLLTFRVGTPLQEVERELILATLAHAGGDKALTATLLGVGRRTIYRKLDEYQSDAAGPLPSDD